MPIYEYHCPKCGRFDALQQPTACDKPGSSPACATCPASDSKAA